MNFEQKLLSRYPELQACLPDLQKAFAVLAQAFHQGHKLLVCGNGGSAADSEHIVGELMKGYLRRRPLPAEEKARLERDFGPGGAYLAQHLQGALPAISLVSQTALLTAFSNDVAADLVFAQQVFGYGAAGDVLLALSTSGNSKNILYALQAARLRGLHTIGLTGCGNGSMLDLCDVTLCAPSTETPVIQEYHVALYHTLCAQLEAEFFEV